MNSYICFAFLAVVASAMGAPAPNQAVFSWDPRIIGGNDAAPGEFPYIVSLRKSNSHFCGGSIINSKYVLTAAHCVVGTSASSITVVTGTNTLDAGGVSHPVTKITVHESYNPNNSWKNDIAIIQLTDEIDLDSLQQPIGLPEQDIDAPDGTAVIASGWGYAKYPGWNLPNDLQTVNLETISRADCQAAQSGTIHETHVCAFIGKGKGVCNGDSGGPLVAQGVLVGIVSWGRPCAVGVPDVYTRVSRYADWIKQNQH